MSEKKQSALGRVLDWRPGTISRVLIVLLLIAPITIAAVYMWSMWDPSKKLHNVPLALVNADKGVKQDGEQQNFGQQVADSLLDTDYLNFTQVSEQEAANGLLKGNYLFTVTIPENFSKDTVTVLDPEPRQPNINVSYNDYNGTNATLLTSGLVPQIQAGVASALSEQYAQKVLDGMNQLGDGLGRALDGTTQLDDGATRLKDGTTQAKDGTQQLADGAAQLDDGTTQLKDGTTRLVDGTVQLDDGAAQLLDGTGQLGDGAAQIDDGVGQLTGMLIPLLEQVGQIAPMLQPVINTLHTVGLNDQAAKLEGIVSQLDTQDPNSTVAQLNKLKAGTAEMRYNLTDPNAPYLSGVIRLKDGTAQVRDGAQQLDDGATQLNDGTARLYDGTSQLQNGAVQLDDGAGKIKDGTSELKAKLAEGVAAAPKVKDVPSSAKQIAVPVAFDSTYHHPVQTAVSAEDPTVKTLSGGVSMLLILVMGYLLMAIVAILAPHLVGRKTRHTRALGPVLRGLAALTGVNAAIIGLLAIFSAVVGWHPVALGASLLTLFMIAFNGAAVYQFSRVLLGRIIGTVASLGFFAYGIFSFGGVWPQTTMPEALTVLGWLHPMTYAREAFVRSTDGIIDSTYWTGIFGMLIITVITGALSVLIRFARTSHHASELREEDRLKEKKGITGRHAAAAEA